LTRHPSDDIGDFLTKITPFIEADGARNLSAIVRELRLPYQTVSFRMRHLKHIGISVIPVVRVEKFGLTRFRATFALGPEKIRERKRFFTALNQKAGLRYYSRSLIKGIFDCEFSIPMGKLDELSRAFEKLESMRLVSEPSFHRVIWKDFPMLKTKYFDYPCGEWDVDLSRIIGDPSVAIPSPDVRTERFDYKDLVITKELEIDTWAKNLEIADRVNLPARDIGYHLNEHVLGRGMISSFRFRWIGTKEAWAKHSIVGLTFIFNNIKDRDTRHAISILTSFPFLWSHSRTDDGMYLAELLIPVSIFNETIQRISRQLEDIDLVPETLLPDWSCSSNYTIPYQLYDRENRKWTLEADRILSSILQQESSIAMPRD
jgi:DNA-binding Lrp family transcriptional regulator